MYFSRMSLRPSSVVAYYNGSEEDYRPPRSAASMLETTHTHLPMMGIVLLFLTHLVIFVPVSPATKKTFIATAFISAVLEESAGWLVRFVSPGFASLKVVGFLGLQASIVFLIGALGAFLLGAARARSARRAARAESRTRRSPAADVDSDSAAAPVPSISTPSTSS
jgi:hypothetical protein